MSGEKTDSLEGDVFGGSEVVPQGDIPPTGPAEESKAPAPPSETAPAPQSAPAKKRVFVVTRGMVAGHMVASPGVTPEAIPADRFGSDEDVERLIGLGVIAEVNPD